MNGADGNTISLVYLLVALLVFGSAAFAARQRAKEVEARGPGVLLSLLIWASAIAAVVLIYRSAQIWAAILSLFS